MPEAGDVERLVVMLEARIKDFERNMTKAEGTAVRSYDRMRRGSSSATRQMEADMVRSTNRINQALATTSTRIGVLGRSMAAGVIAPVAGLLTLTATLNGTKAALEQFGDIADKAAAGGVDAEFFQGIAYQARLAGIDVGGVASALATFAKNAGLAAEGKGRMVSALEALNPELLKSIQAATTQEQRFKLVADAIRDARDAAQAAAIASAAFGDQGVRLVSILRAGGDEIERMNAKAKEMGLIVDRELIAQADELGDEFDTASQIVDLKLKQAFINLAPFLVDAAGWAAEFVRLMGVAADQMREVENRKFINPLQNELVSIQNRRAPILEEIADLQKQLEDLDPKSGWAMTVTAEIKRKAEIAEQLMQEALRLQERIAQLQGKPANDPNTGLPPVTLPGAAAPIAPNPNLMPGADLSLLDLKLPDAEKIDQVAAGLGRVTVAAYDTTMSIGTAADAVTRLRDEWQWAEDLAQDFTSSLVSDLMDGRDAVESVADAFGNLGQQLIEMAANQAINSLFEPLVGSTQTRTLRSAA